MCRLFQHWQVGISVIHVIAHRIKMMAGVGEVFLNGTHNCFFAQMSEEFDVCFLQNEYYNFALVEEEHIKKSDPRLNGSFVVSKEFISICFSFYMVLILSF